MRYNQKFLITEANLTNFGDLVNAINTVLDTKNIPQFAGSETNKVRDWFAKKYVKAVKDDEIDLGSSLKKHKYKKGDPEWMNKSDIMDFSGDLPNEIENEIGHFVDYFATLDANDLRKIDREPYSVIKQKVRDWDQEMAASSGDTKAEDNLKRTLTKDIDYKVYIQLSDGSKWVKLITPKGKDVEGEAMGHCVGGDTYESADIYSLWDSKNRSHVTVEAHDNRKTINQIKGKGNREPVEKYVPACVEFVAEMMLKGYKIVGDGENVGMVKHDDEYHFDELETLPEKYRSKSIFRKWVDVIFPTVIFPKQQKAIADLAKRIVVQSEPSTT